MGVGSVGYLETFFKRGNATRAMRGWTSIEMHDAAPLRRHDSSAVVRRRHHGFSRRSVGPEG